MKDYKLKQRNLRASHPLGWLGEQRFSFFFLSKKFETARLAVVKEGVDCGKQRSLQTNSML